MRQFLFAIFSFFVLHCEGQDSVREKIASNTLYVEGLGAGMRFSINYDKAFRLPINNLYISGSAGIAPSWWNQKYLYFPLRLTVFYGKLNSFAEFDMHMVYGYFWNQSFTNPDQYLTGTQTYWLPSLSYRYQNITSGGLFIKFSFYPIINKKSDSYSYLSQLPFPSLKLYDKDFVPWFGVSAGYTFRPKHASQ